MVCYRFIATINTAVIVLFPVKRRFPPTRICADGKIIIISPVAYVLMDALSLPRKVLPYSAFSSDDP
jgi:hypothetical protein